MVDIGQFINYLEVQRLKNAKLSLINPAIVKCLRHTHLKYIHCRCYDVNQFRDFGEFLLILEGEQCSYFTDACSSRRYHTQEHKNKNTNRPLTAKDGILRSAGEIARILGKNRLHNLGFDVPWGKPTPQRAVVLNKAEEEIPSTFDIAKADDIELQEIMENPAKSMENLTQQLEKESSEDFLIQELLGLDKQLRSIRGSLKVEVAKRFNWKNA